MDDLEEDKVEGEKVSEEGSETAAPAEESTEGEVE